MFFSGQQQSTSFKDTEDLDCLNPNYKKLLQYPTSSLHFMPFSLLKTFNCTFDNWIHKIWKVMPNLNFKSPEIRVTPSYYWLCTKQNSQISRLQWLNKISKFLHWSEFYLKWQFQAIQFTASVSQLIIYPALAVWGKQQENKISQ